jgi:hypothetical protein
MQRALALGRTKTCRPLAPPTVAGSSFYLFEYFTLRRCEPTAKVLRRKRWHRIQ